MKKYRQRKEAKNEISYLKDLENDLYCFLYNLNYAELVDYIIKRRPSAFSDNPIMEWRNAGECVVGEIVEQLKKFFKGKKEGINNEKK